MAKSYSFDRPHENSLIEVTVELNDSRFVAILDTGASHTVIDFGVLIESGYLLDDTQGLVQMETANGIKLTNLFQVRRLSCLGMVRNNFEVAAYLFDDPQAAPKGIIGLDFLGNSNFCIDLKNGVLSVLEE